MFRSFCCALRQLQRDNPHVRTLCLEELSLASEKWEWSAHSRPPTTGRVRVDRVPGLDTNIYDLAQCGATMRCPPVCRMTPGRIKTSVMWGGGQFKHVQTSRLQNSINTSTMTKEEHNFSVRSGLRVLYQRSIPIHPCPFCLVRLGHHNKEAAHLKPPSPEGRRSRRSLEIELEQLSSAWKMVLVIMVEGL